MFFRHKRWQAASHVGRQGNKYPCCQPCTSRQPGGNPTKLGFYSFLSILAVKLARLQHMKTIVSILKWSSLIAKKMENLCVNNEKKLVLV